MRSEIVADGCFRVFEDGTILKIADGVESLAKVYSSGEYLAVCFNRKFYSIHRLVATAFIPNPGNKPYINHKDGNKHNNAISNLEWCTASENNAHAWRNGLNHVSYGTHRKTTGFKNARIKANLSASKVAKEIGVSRAAIYEWEKGTYFPDTKRLPEIAKLYGVTVDDLLK